LYLTLLQPTISGVLEFESESSLLHVQSRTRMRKYPMTIGLNEMFFIFPPFFICHLITLNCYRFED